MSTVRSLADHIATADGSYSCHCIDGHCSNCGECCTDLLPMTDEELRRLKEYAARHDLKPHHHGNFMSQAGQDMTCPFRNDVDHKCDVYEVRPKICRSYICTKTLADAKHDRDLISEKRPTRSVRAEVFGEPSALGEMQQILINGLMRLFS